MWSEWLARTLRRSHAAEAAAMTRAPASMPSEDTGSDDLRPAVRELALAAQDEEVRRVVADV